MCMSGGEDLGRQIWIQNSFYVAKRTVRAKRGDYRFITPISKELTLVYGFKWGNSTLSYSSMLLIL